MRTSILKNKKLFAQRTLDRGTEVFITLRDSVPVYTTSPIAVPEFTMIMICTYIRTNKRNIWTKIDMANQSKK